MGCVPSTERAVQRGRPRRPDAFGSAGQFHDILCAPALADASSLTRRRGHHSQPVSGEVGICDASDASRQSTGTASGDSLLSAAVPPRHRAAPVWTLAAATGPSAAAPPPPSPAPAPAPTPRAEAAAAVSASGVAGPRAATAVRDGRDSWEAVPHQRGTSDALGALEWDDVSVGPLEARCVLLPQDGGHTVQTIGAAVDASLQTNRIGHHGFAGRDNNFPAVVRPDVQRMRAECRHALPTAPPRCRRCKRCRACVTHVSLCEGFGLSHGVLACARAFCDIEPGAALLRQHVVPLVLEMSPFFVATVSLPDFLFVVRGVFKMCLSLSSELLLLRALHAAKQLALWSGLLQARPVVCSVRDNGDTSAVPASCFGPVFDYALASGRCVLSVDGDGTLRAAIDVSGPPRAALPSNSDFGAVEASPPVAKASKDGTADTDGRALVRFYFPALCHHLKAACRRSKDRATSKTDAVPLATLLGAEFWTGVHRSEALSAAMRDPDANAGLALLVCAVARLSRMQRFLR